MALGKACVESPRPVTAQSGPMPDSIPAHDGHRSDMADSIPLTPPNRSSSDRNSVRHASGRVSAITPESCPSWAGARTNPYTITARTNFDTVHRLTPAQIVEMRQAAALAQELVIKQWIEIYITGASPLSLLRLCFSEICTEGELGCSASCPVCTAAQPNDSHRNRCTACSPVSTSRIGVGSRALRFQTAVIPKS